MSWLNKIFSTSTSSKESTEPDTGSSVATMTPTRRKIVLSEETRSKVSELAQNAIHCWGGEKPCTKAVWMIRTAVILARASIREEASKMLAEARELVRQERDPISAESTLSEVATAYAAAAGALDDCSMFDRAMQIANELTSGGFRGIALAHMFGDYLESGNSQFAEPTKKRLMSQMDFLTGFDYSLTVGEVVKVLAGKPESKQEVIKLLETGLTRAKSDKTFGETSTRDVALSYAEMGQKTADKKMIERGIEISNQLKEPRARASVYGNAAVAFAQLNLRDDAMEFLAKQKKEIQHIKDRWDLDHATTENRGTSVVLGVILKDPSLVEAGLEDLNNYKGKELLLVRIVEALVDLAKTRTDAEIATKAGEIAEKLEKPFDRYCRLADRVEVLSRTDHRSDAESLITGARSEAESLSDPLERGSAYLSVADAIIRAAP